MWVIIKTNSNSIGLVQKSMQEKLGEKINFYIPKIRVQKFKKNKPVFKEINLLGDYMFCFNKKLGDSRVLNHLKFTKGLKYFLSGFQNAQSDIENFINRCKKFESNTGSISQNLFELEINRLYKFCDGPFCQKIFKFIGHEKNNIKILIGSITTTIKAKKYLVAPV